MVRPSFAKPRHLVAVGVVLSVALVAAACGSSAGAGATTSPSPSATASAATQVKSDWQQFFSGSTSATTKIGLLQNGQQFAQTIRAQAATAIGKSTQAVVGSVKVVSPTKAVVKYTIELNGQPVLQNTQGQAVLQNGTWKVGASSFQALLKLESQTGGASPSASPSP